MYMQSAAASLSNQNHSPELEKLRSVVESGFTHDWILRIEHSGGSCSSAGGWQEWGETAFAIMNADQLVADVAECHTRHPTHSIRLRAEKINPRTQMLYCIYQAAETATRAARTAPVSVVSMKPINDWPGVRAAAIR